MTGALGDPLEAIPTATFSTAASGICDRSERSKVGRFAIARPTAIWSAAVPAAATPARIGTIWSAEMWARPRNISIAWAALR